MKKLSGCTRCGFDGKLGAYFYLQFTFFFRFWEFDSVNIAAFWIG